MWRKLKLLLFYLFFFIGLTNAQTSTVTGVVISEEDGLPVVGASILIIGSSQGTITDIDGRFTLTNVEASSEFLRISYIGMEATEVKIEPNLTVFLKSDSQLIDELVVVAYGTAKKSSLTGAISTVNADKIEKRPLSDVAAALEGVATGVQVNSSYGEPGQASKIRIRGVGSVNGSNEPLLVLDGAIYSGEISDLNPNDVESISVLKDAASTALYGNRAANGVVLITTRSGRSDRVRVRMNMKQGVFRRGMSDYDRLGTDDWMETMWTGYRNYLMSSSSGRYPTMEVANAEASNSLVSAIIGYNIYNRSNSELFDPEGKLTSGAKVWESIAGDLDWYKPLERTGHRQEYNMSADGASDKAGYYFSVGYLDEKGYMIRSDFERLTGRASITVNPVVWFKTGFNLSGSHQKMNRVTGDPDDTRINNITYANPFNFARNMAPVYPVHLWNQDTGEAILDAEKQIQYDNGNSTYTRKQNGSRHIVWESELDQRFTYRNTLMGQLFGDIKISDFTFSLKGDINAWTNEMGTYNNAIIGDGQGNEGRASRTTNRYKSYTFQQQLSWRKLLNGIHSVDVLVGHENYSYNQAYQYVYKTKETIAGSPQLSNFNVLTSINGYEYDYATESYLSRMRYNYKEKYFVEGSFRRDGSSRFARDNRWGNFWSLGGSWMISEELYMQQVSWVNTLKLRVSYGEVGNDQGVGYYGYMALMMLDQNGNEGAVYNIQNDAADIKWETSQSFGIALEGCLFNRLNFSAEYFDKRSKDLLFDVYLPLSSGGTSTEQMESTLSRNLGTLSNRGFEGSFDADIIRNKSWKWNLGTNFTFQKNRVVSLPDGNKEGIIKDAQKIMEGHSRYEFWTYQWAGVDQLTGNSLYYANLDDYNANGVGSGSAAIPASSLVEVNGEYYTTSTTYAKRDWSGTATPKVFGSVFSTIDWKNFSLSVLCTYSAGNKVYDYSYSALMSATTSPAALHKDILKSWSGVPHGMTENSPDRIDKKGVPVVDYNRSTNNNAVSDRFLHSGSYFSIKNISLAYSLPRTIVNKANLTGVSLNCSIENIAIFTALKGMNPQQQENGLIYNAYMPAKVFSFGLNVNL